MNIFSSFVLPTNGDDLWNRLQIGWWRAYCPPKKKWKNGEKMVNDPLTDKTLFLFFFFFLFLFFFSYSSLCMSYVRIDVIRLSASRVHTRVSWIAPRRQWPNDWMLRQGQRSKQKPRRPCVAQVPAAFHAAQQRARRLNDSHHLKMFKKK